MLQQSVIRHSFLPSFPYARMCDMVVVANEGKKKNLKEKCFFKKKKKKKKKN
jgi:hypothetical protein